MTCTRVRAKVFTDDSGVCTEVPVLLTDEGVLTPLYRYLRLKKVEKKSPSYINSVLAVTEKFLDYMEANRGWFLEPQRLFQTFIKSLYLGTIHKDGLDPSGLYWLPISTRSANKLIGALAGFTDWLAKEQYIKPMTPLLEADSYTHRLYYAAWFRKNRYDFLEHIRIPLPHSTARSARLLQGTKTDYQTHPTAATFPEEDFERFLLVGIGGARDIRVVLRDRLILLLLHGGGLRVSEALSLWVTDVHDHPHISESALVRIYHPENGRAPHLWRSPHGETNRAAYLKTHYGLTPRNNVEGSMYLGWKGRSVDGAGNFFQVHWFPSDYGKEFRRMWHTYLSMLAKMELEHPYAFISFHPDTFGMPYTKNAFRWNYRCGLERIGIKASRAQGYSSHGHRHAYKTRLVQAGIEPAIRQKCLHYSSTSPHTLHTQPSFKEISDRLHYASSLEGIHDFNSY